jgi:hypothetical protein
MPPNVLEALLLPVTSREINDGRFRLFIDQLIPIKPTTLTFVIYVNNSTHTSIQSQLNRINNKFKKIEVVYANMSPIDDVYGPTVKYMPKYGFASGPNILFMAAMKHCSKFDTTLLVETDCIVKPSFLEELELFTKYSGGFLIAGSTYDGNTYTISTTVMFHHINGVALYHTGSSTFQNLMGCLDGYILQQVHTTPFFSYDVAINQLVQYTMLDASCHAEWKRIYKGIIKTAFIVNMSLPSDKDIPMEMINKHYPTHVILHKKKPFRKT